MLLKYRYAALIPSQNNDLVLFFCFFFFFFAVSLLQPDQVSREKYQLMQCNPLHPQRNLGIERWMEREGGREGGRGEKNNNGLYSSVSAH